MKMSSSKMLAFKQKNIKEFERISEFFTNLVYCCHCIVYYDEVLEISYVKIRSDNTNFI